MEILVVNMWYWRKENYEGLLSFAQEIESNSELADYAKYCVLREKGLRKEAFSNLNRFIGSAVTWPLSKRYAFVDLLFTVQHGNSNIYDLMPQPLLKRLVEPTLQQWVQANPEDPSGYRWLGDEENWRIALSLDENDQISLVRLVERLIYNSYFSTHHLPDGYIGNPSEDMMELNEALGLLPKIQDQSLKDKLARELGDYKELVENYLQYSKSRFVGSFERWADLYSKRCS